MTSGAPRRPSWARGVLLAALALALVAFAFVFGAANGPQSLRLTFGIFTWRGEAVHALFAAFLAGLLVMFLVGLSTDLAVRAERRRLEGRIRELEREAARTARRDVTPPEPRASAPPEPRASEPPRTEPTAPEFARPIRNPGDAEAV